MQLLRHSIQIKSDIEAAFQICTDVENWPKFFPPCLKATVLMQEGNRQLIEITAKTNDQISTWQSERFIDVSSRTIEFRQVKPINLLNKMEGAWRFDSLYDSILVSLEHHFEVKDNVSGIMEGVYDKSEAVAYMQNAIHLNTVKELNALRQILEKQHWSSVQNKMLHKFQTEKSVPKPIKLVHDALWDVKNWPSLLPHCKKINMLYEDEIYQEFIMQIMGGEMIESMRSIRYSPGKRKINYFQPEPPILLKQHRGEWILEPLDCDNTRVISSHEIVLNPEGIREKWGSISLEEALERIQKTIKTNSLRTIQAIDELAYS